MRFYFYSVTVNSPQIPNNEVVLMELTIDLGEQTVSILLKAEQEEVAKSYLVMLSTALSPFLT